MARLFCKLSHERGEKVSVGGSIYTIGADGFVDVDDGHAEILLQNSGKWASGASATATPFKRPLTPAQPILADRTGRELSDEETAALVKAVTPKFEAEAPDVSAKEAPVEVPDDVVADDEGTLAPDPAPDGWPVVSTDTTKAQLIALGERLVAAGHAKANSFDKRMNKNDLLEAIEQAYDTMA